MATSLASSRNPADRNADATVHVAQLDEKVTDALLLELMVQAAPVRHVYIPRNRITGAHYGYGFCEFYTPLDAQYAAKVFNLVHVFSKPIRISQSTLDRRSQDVGANLFIGNLVDEVDEKLLYDAFSAFGPILEAPYIMRDPNTNESKRYGFVKYTSFENSDAAITAMNGQYICNAPISVQYAFKKDSDTREKHGSQAERILAQSGAEARLRATVESQLRPHTLFSDRPVTAPPQERRAPVLIPPPEGYGSMPEENYYQPHQHYNHMQSTRPQSSWQHGNIPPHSSTYNRQGYPPEHANPQYNRGPQPATQLGWSQRPHGNRQRAGNQPNVLQSNEIDSTAFLVSDDRAPPAPHR